MGRGVSTKRVSISTAAKRDAWMKKRDKHFEGVATFNSKERLWVILNQTKDLVMIDKQLAVDEDGEEVYRLVYSISKDGKPSSEWGSVRTYSTTFMRKQFCDILPDEWQEKLDGWIKSSVTEDVIKEDERGMRFPTLECKPLKLKVPGWERLTPNQLQKRREDNLLSLVGQFFFPKQ